MPKVRPLTPIHSRGCGPICIKMAVDYFDMPYSLSHIDKISRCRQKGGLTNKDLLATLKRLGLSVSTKRRSSWKDLRSLNTEKNVVILSWMLNGYVGHYSVLDKVTSEHIYLADPEKSDIIKISKFKFMRLWFDYEDIWYPQKTSDIQLRWLAVVKKSKE